MRRGPDYIQLYPTLRCNRSCGFCFNHGLSLLQDMNHGDFGRMLAVLRDAGVQSVDIMGGEPTLHRDITAMVAETLEQGLTVNISSNGSDLATLRTIMGMEETLTAGISVNDWESLRQVSLFVEQHRPVVKTVSSPRLDRALAETILSLEPKRYYLLFRDALDRASLDASESFPGFLANVKRDFEHRIGTVYCSGFLTDPAAGADLADVRCPAGTSKLGILPDGSVYPCNLFFGKKEFLLGNILSDSFADIWNHDALDFFRSASPNRCPISSCELHAQCHGGCPAHSLILNGDLTAPDPRCVHAE